MSKKARARKRAAERKLLRKSSASSLSGSSRPLTPASQLQKAEENNKDPEPRTLLAAPKVVTSPKAAEETSLEGEKEGMTAEPAALPVPTATETELEATASSSDGDLSEDSASEGLDSPAAEQPPSPSPAPRTMPSTPRVVVRSESGKVSHPLSPPGSPTLSKLRRAQEAPPSSDHQPGTKWRSIITRTVWTFLMIAGIIGRAMIHYNK